MVPSPPAVQYCGRCGAPLAPGAGFCGRCGTPATVAAPPAHMYPPAPPYVAYPTRRQTRLSQAMIAGGLIVILLVVGAIVSSIAVSQFVGGIHSTCTSNCGPKFVTPLSEEASYKSTAYGYQVNYSSAWNVRAKDAGGVTLGTKIGSVQIAGSPAADSAAVLQSTVNSLPSSRYQDVTFVGNLKGAHIGDQDGIGSVYSANFVGASQTAIKVRFAVIVATHGGVTIAVLAIDPADPKNSPNGMPEGQEFDYLCTEIAWT